MKKYWKMLLCAALGITTFTACEDVPEPYNIPTEQGGPDTPTPSGIEVTCAEAVELTRALADGASSNETYTITGYITEIVGDVSKNQQTFWMADTQNGGRVFEAYWANLPEGVTAFTAGSKVKITGKLTKYVNNNTGNMTAEIKNATVEILESGSTPTPAEGIAVTCAEAANIVNTLADGGVSTDTYTVTGYITEIVGDVSKNQQTFWMADTPEGGRVFEAYWANLPEGVSAFKKGSKVKITGQLMKYVNTKTNQVTPEIKNATVEILEEGGGETPTPQPTGEAKGSGTLADPYNAVAANQIATDLGAGNTSTDKYYIKGKISEIKYQFDVEHGTATFFISDNGEKQNQFQVYSTYYLGNKSWQTGNKQIAVGDEVIVYGQLTNYNGTPETASKKSYIYSLNGATADEGGNQGEDNPSDDNPSYDGNSITFSANGYANAQDFDGKSITLGDATLNFSKGSGSTTPKYYNAGTAMRLYGGNILTISSKKTIAKIEFTYGEDYNNTSYYPVADNSEITPSGYDYSTHTWTGNANKVELTRTAATGHFRIVSITITYAQ